jgi:hypothetical protein
MDSMLMDLARYELEFQCRAILSAKEHFVTALHNERVMSNKVEDHVAETGTTNIDWVLYEEWDQARAEVWMHIQSMLIAAANIQKMLWGQGGKKALERASLRAQLNVPEASPFRDPDIRNDFEHFDERLVDWWNAKPTSWGWSARNIGDVPAGLTRFQHYNNFTGEVTFLSHSLALGALLDATVALMDRLLELKPYRPGKPEK